MLLVELGTILALHLADSCFSQNQTSSFCSYIISLNYLRIQCAVVGSFRDSMAVPAQRYGILFILNHYLPIHIGFCRRNAVTGVKLLGGAW